MCIHNLRGPLQPTQFFAHLLQLSPNPWSAPLSTPFDDQCFADPGQLIQQPIRTDLDPGVRDFALEQSDQYLTQETTEGMDLDLLIRPVKLRPDRQMIGILQLPENPLDPSQPIVSFNDLRFRPSRLVGKEDLLTEHLGRQCLIPQLIKRVIQAQPPGNFFDFGSEELVEMFVGQQSSNLPFDCFSLPGSTGRRQGGL